MMLTRRQREILQIMAQDEEELVYERDPKRLVMKDMIVVSIAGVASVLMAAAGALRKGRLAVAGVCLMFVAAVWKYAQRRRNTDGERRDGSDRHHSKDAQHLPGASH